MRALCFLLPVVLSAQPVSIAKQGFFYVGGRTAGEQLVDAMFVQYQIPARVRVPYPVVMIHGQWQNGSNFLGTPDDRPGWAEFFLRRGFAVYVVDQPARGRSAYSGSVDGPLTLAAVDVMERQFTAPEKSNLWPQARLHTQWPGTGLRGDPAFEQFRASQNASMTDNVAMDAANLAAGVALLKRIGPAILMTHSRSGPFGWEIADAVPELVKGIVAVEPNGPPFYNMPPIAASEVLGRPWGLTYLPVTFDPPLPNPQDWKLRRETTPQAPDKNACWLPEQPRKLVKLSAIPVLLLTAEASYHAPYDHCTAQFLTQSGVRNEFVRLEAVGIHGNGHMMMLEKNNLDVAGVIAKWIEKNVKR